MRDLARVCALVVLAGACTGDGRAAPTATAHGLRQTVRWPAGGATVAGVGAGI